MTNKYHPFLQAVPDDDDDGPRLPSMPADLQKAIEAAMQFSETVSDADLEYSQAAVMAQRLISVGDGLMDSVAQEHGITVANSPEPGGYALRTLGVATPEQLAATFQALNQGYDMAMYAFLTAYKALNAILSDPMVEIHIGGMGSITRVQSREAERKVKLMMQLQSPREAERAKQLAAGLLEIEKTLTPGSEERVEATSALYTRVNEAVKNIPNHYPDEEEDAAHG